MLEGKGSGEWQRVGDWRLQEMRAKSKTELEGGILKRQKKTKQAEQGKKKTRSKKREKLKE